MVRGIRGAITATRDDENEILAVTEKLLAEMIRQNEIDKRMVAHIMITVTTDLTATFPAKALRRFPDWKYVPVMCATEIPVPNSLQKCIRVMITVNTSKPQEELKHVYLEGATNLRPDLQLTKED